jgi:Methyltransferase domain.
MTPLPGSAPCSRATAQFYLLAEAVRSGIVDAVEAGSDTPAALADCLNLQPDETGRFVDLLCTLGLLQQRDDRLGLSPFSQRFLSRASTENQRNTLLFEPLLIENWRQVGTILQQGQGALTQPQPQDAYHKRLELFQASMAEAASVRSAQLWHALAPLLPPQGIIMDIGAGEGAYLRAFLQRYPDWQGIACDLPDVCVRIMCQDLPGKLTVLPCNILDQQEFSACTAAHHGTAGLVLLSNLLHCYGPQENGALLEQAAGMLTPDGLLVVHDFFRDANLYGALYDLHMLVNTWNGRCYSSIDTSALLQEVGLTHTRLIKLPSHSWAVLASRSQVALHRDEL